MTERVVVVVGASSGIGLATAIAFAGRGEHLVLASRSAEALESAEAACRVAGAGAVDTVAEDIADPAAAGRIVARVLDRHGRIDVVVHTATVMGYGTFSVGRAGSPARGSAACRHTSSRGSGSRAAPSTKRRCCESSR